MDPGLLGGIVGGTFGLIGGAIGTYFSITNTAGPQERRFMIRVAAVAWVAITLFLVGVVWLPRPFNWLLWGPYAIALPLSILWCNRRQMRIRAQEAAGRGPGASR